MSLLVGIDQGTSGTTVVTLDDALRVRGTFTRKVISNVDGHAVEQDPWHVLDTISGALDDALSELGSSQAATVGFAHQGETVLAWNKTSLEPLTPAVVWSDRRSLDIARRLERSGLSESVKRLSSNRLDSYFCAAKYAWLLEINPALRSKEVALGTLETWLLAQFGIETATDVGTASRTQLTRLGSSEWDHELLEIFGVPAECLSPILPSLAHRGELQVPGLDAVLPLEAVLVDQPAALVGSGCVAAATAKVTYGTGAFVVMNVGRHRPTTFSRLVSSVGWGDDRGPVYTYDGGVFSAGSGLDWLSEIGIDTSPDAHQRLLEASPTTVKILPALHGLGAPHWDREAKAAIVGLDASSSGADLLQGLLDGIAFRTAEIFDEFDQQFDMIRVDGGLAASRYLMQAQADVLGTPLGIGTSKEATAVGAALLAGLHAGVVSDAEIADVTRPSVVIEPEDGHARQRYMEWKAAFAPLLRDEPSG